MSDAPVGVLLVDDQEIVLAGIAAIIRHEPGIEVVGTAKSVEEASGLIEADPPDVVVSDVQIGERSGLELLERFPSGRPPIILLSSFEHLAYYQAALDRGAAGYVLKADAVAQLVTAIRTVAAGGIAFPAHVLRDRRAPAARPPSRRELEVVHQVAEGHSNDEIGARLGISPKTVDSHLRALYERYEVVSRTELAMLAVSHGWLRAADRPETEGSEVRLRWMVDESIVRRR